MNETLEHLMSQIDEERKAISDSLGNGAARTFEDYKYAAGTVRGLLIAQSIIADLAKKMETFDE